MACNFGYFAFSEKPRRSFAGNPIFYRRFLSHRILPLYRRFAEFLKYSSTSLLEYPAFSAA